MGRDDFWNGLKISRGSDKFNAHCPIRLQRAALRAPECIHELAPMMAMASRAGLTESPDPCAMSQWDCRLNFTAGEKKRKYARGPSTNAIRRPRVLLQPTPISRRVIHTEVIGFDGYIAYRGEQGSKEAAKIRIEGEEYVAKDSEVMHSFSLTRIATSVDALLSLPSHSTIYMSGTFGYKWSSLHIQPERRFV